MTKISARKQQKEVHNLQAVDLRHETAIYPIFRTLVA